MTVDKNKEKYLSWLFIFVIFVILIIISFYKIDSDFFHIYNSGRWIVEHKAVPYENYEFVLPGYKTVVQQWLYSIGLYYAAQFGYIGVALFTFVQAVLLSVMFYIFAGTLNHNKASCFIAVILSLLVISQYINCRPQMITVMLLLASMTAIEKYRAGKNKAWLYLLPVFTLLEANLHVTCVMFHLVIILPYAVPFMIKKYNINIRRTDLIIPCLLSAGAMFINPYGVKGVLCVFSTAGDLKKYVAEMGSPDMLSRHGIFLALTLTLLFLLYKKNRLNSVIIWFAVGFGCLYILSFRNCVFMSIVVCYAAAVLLDITGKSVLGFFDKVKIGTGKMTFLTLYLICHVGYMFIFVFYSDLLAHNNDFSHDVVINKAGNVPDLVQYIKDNENVDTVKAFTMFNIGSYFVYEGIDHIYMQAKSEPYNAYVNEKEDIMKEYLHMISTADDNEIGQFLDKYDFDYMCFDVNDSLMLYTHLCLSDEYEEITVDTEKQDDYVLFRKK